MDVSKAERLAALLDGNCTERERQELLEELAAGGEELEVFADAAAVLHEPGEVPPRAGVAHLQRRLPKPHVRAWWKPPRARLLAGAGTVLTLALVALLAWPRDGRETSGPAQRLHEMARPRLAPQLQGMATRGENPCAALDRRQCAVLVGSRLMQLETAVQVAPDKVPQLAGDLAVMVESPNLARRYREIQQNGLPAGGLDPKLAGQAETATGHPDAARLGEWIEAARAAVGDASFFATAESRRVRSAGEPYTPLLRPAAGEVARLDTALKRTPPDWPGVQAALDDLLRRLTG